MNKDFLSFKEARKFVIKLKLIKYDDWIIYTKSGKKPKNIPSTPNEVYKKLGWISFGHWLGTNRKHEKNRKLLKFKKARNFSRNLKIENVRDWEEYAKSGKKPINIPSHPDRYYKDWKSWGDWLGNNNMNLRNKIFLEFEDAKKIVHTLKIKIQKEWNIYAKSGKKPKNIPYCPQKHYDEWISWGDWLGNKIFLEFEDAKKIVHTLKIKTQKEYKKYISSKNKLNNIPSSPNSTYKNKGWISWGDWLGTNNIASKNKIYLDFNIAHNIIIKLKLKNHLDWVNYCKKNKNINIPSNPNSTYKNKGWISWGDWLGTETISCGLISKQRKEELLKYLYSIKPLLLKLNQTELYTIIKQSGNLELLETNISLINIKNTQEFTKEREKVVNDEIKKLEDNLDIEEEISNIPSIENIEETEVEEILQEEEKISLTSTSQLIEQLKSFDDCNIIAGLDKEAINFLKKRRINEYWNNLLNNNFDLELFKNTKFDGHFFNIVKEEFLQEYNDTINIEIPKNYIFKDKSNKIIKPNLMQLLSTHRIIKDNVLGNWSGTGGGKTLAAILASKILNANIIAIIAPNSVLDNWKDKINSYFTKETNNIITKIHNPNFVKDKNNYWLLNYEWFQQPNSESQIYNVLKNNKIDFIVSDEIHLSKQRNNNISKRRDNILKFITKARQDNTDIKIMGLSATPVINNLKEAKSLLEMMTGLEYSDLDTQPTLNNALNLHQQLVLHGLRYIPKYDINIKEEIIEINGNHLISELKELTKGDILGVEQLLIKDKLLNIKQYLKKGTLIYTYYIEDIIPIIKDFCEKEGFTVGVYSGNDKTGLKYFKEGKVDILIGSNAISTGIDGLQEISDRIIPMILPWTSAEYEQLKGRIYRQGSNFDKVDIIIPKIEIKDENNEVIWSWDRNRLNKIKYKKDISNCVIDGIIPDDKRFIKEESLLKKSQESLLKWIERIESDNIYTIDRKNIEVCLKDTTYNIEKIKSEFSQLNKEWSIKNSSNTHNQLKTNPKIWVKYHALYREARKTWNEIPYKIIADKIGKEKQYIVADLGCGENLLKLELTNSTVKGYDHIAIDENVTSCDISKLPLNNESVNISVLSLSLMGSNSINYIKEAHRILKSQGWIYIAEPIVKFLDEEKLTKFKKELEEIGFELFPEDKHEKFIYFKGIKK